MSSSTAPPSARPPVVLLGGGHVATAISVARGLGRQGVAVYFLGEADAPERHSRYVRYVPTDGDKPGQQAWFEYLTGRDAEHLRGAVLLACSDAGLELVSRHRAELSGRYRLDISNPSAQVQLLDKLSTYRLAASAGLATPRFWEAEDLEQVLDRKDEYAYPLMVKPLYSHQFSSVFGRKYFLVQHLDELVATYRMARARGLEVMLLEMIPGTDDRLCSYYTYIDETGDPLFHFTKRIIRRYPEHSGLGCYHITDWNTEARDLGLRLFLHAGLLGLGNVEFKRDDRDGLLKIIECNARFTAANGLVAASGYNLAYFVYNRLCGIPQEDLATKRYKTGLRLWHPGRDVLAFLELRRKGRLTIWSWLRSIMHKQLFPYFCWDDPAPSFSGLLLLPKRLRRLAVQQDRSRIPSPAEHDQTKLA